MAVRQHGRTVDMVATPYGMASAALFGKPVFSETTKKFLAAAKPDIPAATKSTTTNSVKVATSNLFIENEPDVTVDQITEVLFDRISAKEILGLAKTNNVSTNFQVFGLTDNISNIQEITSSYTPNKILPIQEPFVPFVEDVKEYTSSTSTNGTVTISSVETTPPPKTKIVVQVLTPTTVASGTRWLMEAI